MDKPIKGFMTERSLANLKNDLDQYSDLVKGMLWDEICSTFDSIEAQLLMGINSPIEQALCLAFVQGYEMTRLRVSANRAKDRAIVEFEPQYPVKVNGKTYYLDFNLSVNWADGTGIKIAVECDGHDFHEKTKEQAKKDRQRERALTSAGYTVVRFTGSEIYKDPYKCAEELCDMAIGLFDKAK